MSRTRFHEFKNIFLASPTTIDTEVSASSGVSLASPASGEFLEVWQIDVDGRASNTGTSALELRDGVSGNTFRFIEVGIGESKTITFGGLPKRFDTTIWLQTIGEAVRTAIHYVPRRSR